MADEHSCIHEKIIIGLCILTAISILWVSGYEDTSPSVTRDTQYFTVSGPSNSVKSLLELNPDALNERVSFIMGQDSKPLNIKLISPAETDEICLGHEACADVGGPDIYMTAGYIWEGSAWVLAHELCHSYGVRDQETCNIIAGDMFPEHLRSR